MCLFRASLARNFMDADGLVGVFDHQQLTVLCMPVCVRVYWSVCVYVCCAFGCVQTHGCAVLVGSGAQG